MQSRGERKRKRKDKENQQVLRRGADGLNGRTECKWFTTEEHVHKEMLVEPQVVSKREEGREKKRKKREILTVCLA